MDIISDVPWAPLLVLVPLVFVSLSYRFYVHPAHVSPLSKIPNAHWSAPISPLWILHKRFKRRENGTLEDAHKRLGPFVRVAPNEVSVDDLAGVRKIYQGGFEKPEWYAVFDNYGSVFGHLSVSTQSLLAAFVTNAAQGALHVFGTPIEGPLSEEAHDRKRILEIVYPLIAGRGGPSRGDHARQVLSSTGEVAS